MFSESFEQAGPLITVWLQVRVLPGPPANSVVACQGLFRLSGITATETAPDICAFRSPAGSLFAIFSTASAK